MNDKSLTWINEIEIADLLDKDMKMIHDHCGVDVAIMLWENFSSMNIYVSTRPLDKIKKRYIKKHCNGHNIKDLCRLLDVSERFVYEVLEEKGIIHTNQEPLF